jgi:hypothetical protein
VKHENFYENLAEAHIRLRYTVVMYGGLPYYVHAITDHKGDGVFRMYLEPLGRDPGLPASAVRPNWLSDYGSTNPTLGSQLDEWMTGNTKSPIIRKKMNSPYFDKFRPFPLGMINVKDKTYYLERQPTRQREQGLTRSMVVETWISLNKTGPSEQSLYCTDILSPEMRSCILGEYKSPEECLRGLLDPEIVNTSLGFHRYFALIRGPVNIVFLAYKGDVVGVLPNSDFSRLILAKEFDYVREAVEELQLFGGVSVSAK